MDVIADDATRVQQMVITRLVALEIFNWETTSPYVDGKWLALFAGVNEAMGYKFINKSDNPSEFSTQAAKQDS